MATQAQTPQEVEKARDFEKERAAIRAKLSDKALTEEKDYEKKVRDLNQELAQIDADEANSKRSGIGTRLRVGQTRGKNPMVITWEEFDESKPETLPASINQFTEVTKVSDEKLLLEYLITGLNQANYVAASDPLAEYVDFSWPIEAQAQFRLVVRNYSRGAQVSLDDAVALIKPGFVKQFGGATPTA